MATWTLYDIMQKVRATTGRPDESQLSNENLVDYINRYYQFVMPKELKTFFGYTYYTFFTQPGIPTYTVPTDNSGSSLTDNSTFMTLNPQVYIGGFPVDWYIDPDLFFQDYPMQENTFPVATGDGANANFPFTVPNNPILPGSLYVTDSGTPTAQVGQDDGVGGFILPFTGTVDYVSGAVSVSFPTAPAANTNITATCQQYISNRPQGILFFDNKFTLRSVPDQVYKVTLEGIRIPIALELDLIDPADSTDLPYRTDMGPLIAFGASLEIFSDFNQMDQYQQYLVQYNRYKDISMQDTYEEYMYERAIPKF